MALFGVGNQCAGHGQCKKNGLIKCDGCSARFCSEHFNSHRRELEKHFEVLCSERDQFYYEIKHQSNDFTDALTQIDLWEEQTLGQVKQTANKARCRIKQIGLKSNSNEQLQLFSDELRKRKENEDFFEDDIEILRRKLEQIKRESKQISKMNISHTQIQWDNLIQINTIDNKQFSDQLFHGTLFLDIIQQQILNRFCQRPNQKWKLIYRGTRDGFADRDFIRCCHEQGPTLALISVGKYLFGGYTSVNWKDTKDYLWNDDPSAFIFTLVNPHGIPPTKYPIKSSGYRAIRSSLQFGPTFGEFDICINSNSHRNCDSNIGFPHNYSDTTGKGRNTFTGSHFFQTTEIEVYKQV